MTRQEALAHFKVYVSTVLADYEEAFWKDLQNQYDTLERVILEGFTELAHQVQAQQKRDIVHFQFSLLYTDLLARKYTVLLQATDIDWYLDEKVITVSLDISFLYEKLNDCWTKLLQESKKYVGKVNGYDINHYMYEKIMATNKLIAHSLRFILRDIEKNEAFQSIPKNDFWVMRWGEYRDQSEIILQVDRNAKTIEEWQEALQKLANQEDELVWSYWYELKLNNADLEKKILYFIHFEKSMLEAVAFEGAALLGAQFKNCTLTNCSFKNALLKYSDFRNSHFENVDFEGADLTEAIFSEVDVPYLHLSPQQLQLIHIERG